jgi:hypothetical protein
VLVFHGIYFDTLLAFIDKSRVELDSDGRSNDCAEEAGWITSFIIAVLHLCLWVNMNLNVGCMKDARFEFGCR